MAGNRIGSRICELRTGMNMSQEDLARKIYVKRETIAQWEAGTRDIKTIHTVALGDFFKVSCDYILCRTDNRTTEAASVGEITGLSDKAIAVLKYYTAYYRNDHDNILPLINFLLGQEMSPAHIALMRDRLEQQKTPMTYDDMMKNSDDGLLPGNDFIEEYANLCGKPKKCCSVFSEMLKYFNTPLNDNEIYITDKGELCDEQGLNAAKGIIGYRYKQSEIIENMLLLNIRNAIQTNRGYWQAQNNDGQEKTDE